MEVAYPQPSGDSRPAPRLFGQPIVKSLRRGSDDAQTDPAKRQPLDPKLIDALNFTLSTAKVPLTPGSSDLTFFLDTKTPEKLEDIRLNLMYQINELEYDITDVTGINDYQASSWLNFILPIAGASTIQNANYLGDVDIPIPLRTYPIPPSLVLHRAEADLDSLKDLAKIREWQYTYVYEHLDIAQDAIETRIDYNVGATEANVPATTGSGSPEQHALFVALVNFTRLYPQILPDLLKLEAADASASEGVIKPAVAASPNPCGRDRRPDHPSHHRLGCPRPLNHRSAHRHCPPTPGPSRRLRNQRIHSAYRVGSACRHSRDD